MPKQPMIRVTVPSAALATLVRNALPKGMRFVVGHCHDAAFTVILPGPKVGDSAQVPTVSASIGGDGKLIVPVPAGMGGGL